MGFRRTRTVATEPSWTEEDGWLIAEQVGPRAGPDRRTGWLPASTPAPVTRVSTREPDELDLFLASQGIEGIEDVDAWGGQLGEEPPPSWFSRLATPWRAVLATCLIAVIGVSLFAGYRFLTASPNTRAGMPAGATPVGAQSPSPGGPSAPEQDPEAVPAPGGSAGPTSAATSAARLMVHVVGRVKNPGVVNVTAGSRVADAVAAAGGALPDADVSRVNLARAVSDGEQIVVPAPGEAVPAAGGGQTAGAGAGAGQAAEPGGEGATVNVNTADAAALDTLPGVGPVLAQRIIEHREQQGPFTSVEDLLDVSGIGEKLLEKLRPRVTV